MKQKEINAALLSLIINLLISFVIPLFYGFCTRFEYQ